MQGDVSEQIEALRKQLSSLSKTVEDLLSDGADIGGKTKGLVRKGSKAMHEAVEQGKAAISGIESTVSANPLVSVAVAFGIGFMVGRLIRR
jgi:ElaB/YqjD/DUF883 family membrane-anchored ribosome-binding protein